MPKIKLNKSPQFSEKLIDNYGSIKSNINLQGSFVLNLKSNEQFIYYDTSKDSWFLDIPDVNLNTINQQITQINLNILNIENVINQYLNNWIDVNVSTLNLRGYDDNDSFLYSFDASVPIGNSPDHLYFNNENSFFKYKILGKTAIIKYLFAIDIPETIDYPQNLFKIELNLLDINSNFNFNNTWADRYYCHAIVPNFIRVADHIQMCYFKNNKLIFTCNNYINGHHSDISAFNFDHASSSFFYDTFKLIISGSHIFEII